MYGRLEQTAGRWTLRFTRTLPHAPEKVWRALTEAEHLEAWFPTSIEGERTAGARLRFAFRGGEGAPMKGEMISYEPPSLLEFRWGEETLRFSLEADGEGTVLTLVNTFDELGKAARDAAGWHGCLDVLEYELNGEQAPWTPSERWEQVHDHYVESLGPEAATVGPPGSA